MQWSDQQAAALDNVRRWIDAPIESVPLVFRLWGYAGTGKSTLAHELNDHVGGRALACAYTGKAASVMARKGLPGASTVHRLIYTPTGGDEYKKHIAELKAELKLLEAVREPSRGLNMRIERVRSALRQAEQAANQPRFLLKSREECEVPFAPLVILDECSMVPEDMARDMMSFGTKLLVLGDPAQLPPVKGTGFFIDATPDVLLTEVHRQARDNPIVSLATAIREGRSLPRGSWTSESGSASVVDRIDARQALAADQILCGTNKKRQAINRRHRDLGGHLASGPMPRVGEKLVCLRNNHDAGLLNGTLWYCTEDVEWEPGQDTIHLRIHPEEAPRDTPDDLALGVPAEACIFIDEDQKPQWGSAEQFTYGYCLTVHKSQGSQWDNVILFDDWSRRSDSYKNWLYTGVTRAAENLTVVLG